MSLKIVYRTVRPIAPAEALAVRRAAERLNEGRTWLSCEPIRFFEDVDEDGRLGGASKLNLAPPGDAASAAIPALPDGTTRSLLDVLRQLSRDHGLDWELGCVGKLQFGAVRAGVCDERARTMIEAFADLGDSTEGFDIGAGD